VKLKKAKLVSTLDMLTEKDTMVRVAGTITGLEKKTAKNKKSYIVFVLEDAFGTLRCTVFSRQLAKTELFLTDNMTVVVTGKLKVSGSSIQEEELRGELIVEMVEPLEGEHSTLHLTMALGLRLDTLNCTELKRCYDLLQEHRGESNLLIIIQGRVIPYEYKPGFDITANEDLIRNLKEIKGASCNIRSD
jgi:DNA polymerase III alpha subunit